MNWKPALALLGTLVASCAIDDPIDPDDPGVPDPVATLVAPVSGGGQTGGAGRELATPLGVLVLDQFGEPVAGVTVVWAALTGGGSITPVSSTDDAGVATAQWTLGGELGEQSAQATTEPATTVVRFTASAVAGPAAAIQLAPDTLHFDALGDTARVAVTAQDAFGHPIASPTLTWITDHENRASVNGAGLVTATGAGTTRVIASAGATADTVVVVVAQAPALVVVTPATDTLIGATDSVALRASVFDPNGRAIAGAAIAWSSTSTAVATVSAAGVVDAVAEGSAMIVATHGAIADSALIVVRIPTALELLPAADTLSEPGDTLRLRAYVTGAAGDTIAGAPVQWSSLDTLIARVDAYGRVTALDAGDVSIVASLGALADSAAIAVAPDTTAAPSRNAERRARERRRR